MAMPPSHNRVSFLGTLLQISGVPTDIFDFGFASSDALTPQALATALAGPAHDQWATVPLASSAAQLTGVRVEAISLAGKVTNSYTAPVTAINGIITTAPPTICSLCVTLETASVDGHGRKVRGRFYPPGAPSVGLGSSFAASDVSGWLTSWKGFMEACKTAGAIPIVASTTNGGLLAPVTHLSCDNVLDTQRRRKNALIPTRTQGATL